MKNERSEQVKLAAYGQWDMILQNLCGLSDKETIPTKSGMPCPNCGGHDRYEFKSADDGYHMCRGCGAGDGFCMVMKLLSCSFPDAVKRVEQLLGLTPETSYMETEVLRRNHQSALQAKAVAQEERVRSQYEQAKQAAHRLMQGAAPANPDHPYLVSKQLPPFDLLQDQGNLLIPLFDENHNLVNIERIAPDGRKRGLKGGLRRGVYHRFGEPSWTVLIAEGWASAASIYLSEDCACRVYAAMGKSNLEAVCQVAARQNPESRFVVVADNDTHLPDNPGVHQALAAAYGIGAGLIIPVMESQTGGVDASDIYTSRRDIT